MEESGRKPLKTQGLRALVGLFEDLPREEKALRTSTLFRRLLGVTKTIVDSVEFRDSELLLRVRPTWRKPRCGRCGKRASVYDQGKLRKWKHLPSGATRFTLLHQPRRVSCKGCGVRVELVPWARTGSRFTLAFEEMAAYLAQSTDKTTVTKLLGVSWRGVGSIIERVVAERLEATRFDDLTCIGVDEFSYRSRHRYITVVVDHVRQRVIWAGEGRGAETLHTFFDLLGEERLAKIDLVTIDMAAGYKKATAERIPHARVVYDRFHVARLAGKAVDEVRREEVRNAGEDRARMLKRSRYALLRHPDHLSEKDVGTLQRVRQASSRLARAYDLKEWLAEILDVPDIKQASSLLEDWLAWAQRSKLKPFVRLGRTIRKHCEGILAYIRTLRTNAFVEGINNRLRMIARRAFGFHSHRPLVAMLYLNCGGILLDPPLPRTHSK